MRKRRCIRAVSRSDVALTVAARGMRLRRAGGVCASSLQFARWFFFADIRARRALQLSVAMLARGVAVTRVASSRLCYSTLSSRRKRRYAESTRTQPAMKRCLMRTQYSIHEAAAERDEPDAEYDATAEP